MSNPWKLATIGMALTMTTALVTGLSTAYFVQPSARAHATPATTTNESPRTAAPRRSSVAAAPATLATRPAPPAPAPPALPSRVETVAQPPTMPASTPDDCARGGDRAWRVAKPGLLGGLIGAGVGAAGGAIADGGKAAGKGAAIGGLAGAVLGTGYGAYKTRQECGTIFGSPGTTTASAPAITPGERLGTPQAALQPATSDGITVYRAR